MRNGVKLAVDVHVPEGLAPGERTGARRALDLPNDAPVLLFVGRIQPLKAPDIAENSAIVHIEIESKLPGTETIWVFADKNPQPLVAQFDLLPGVDPFVAVRIKMADSAFIRAVVKANGKYWFAQKETKVTIGGCAG